MGKGWRREALWQCGASRGASLNLEEVGPEKEKDGLSTTSPSAPSRQLPATLLKIPGHSAPGLEVAQS